MAAKFKAPNIENATPGHLLDLIGMVRAQANYLKKLEEFYKAAFKARAGNVSVFEGAELFDCTIETTTTRRISPDAVREYFANQNQEVPLELYVDGETTTLRTVAKPDTAYDFTIELRPRQPTPEAASS